MNPHPFWAQVARSTGVNEAERRRAANRRLGWTLGAVVLALYLVGLFVPR